MPPLISKLVSILHVKDPAQERRFYELFGLETTCESDEDPGFIAVGNDRVEFGPTRDIGSDPASAAVTWQLGVRNR
jgi:hypothetical protein